MDRFSIGGMQQLGVGVRNVEAGFDWYRAHFGMDLPVFREAAPAPFMTRYTGDEVQSRDAMLAVNMSGGAGFEIWQYTSRTPQPPVEPVTLGDLGLAVGRIKSRRVGQAYQKLQEEEGIVLSGVTEGPDGTARVNIRDPFDNLFQIVESGEWFSDTGSNAGGVAGAIVGVSDVDASIAFYREILGLDRVVYDQTGTFADFEGLPGGDGTFRRALLTTSVAPRGPFGPLFGTPSVELVQATSRKVRVIFADRYWGDLGFIHLCFDVTGMEALAHHCAAAGHPFTVDSGQESFDMGEAGGRFAYTEDPDGTLIEFVETHKIPVVRKLNWYLDLRKREAGKPLPRYMLKAMELGRVRK